MKVINRQGNSKNCIICGMENELGLKAPFYNMEDGSVATVFEFGFYHQSYPERTHGGMITSLLDEVMGRVLWHNATDATYLDSFAVTTSLSVKYRKPVPYGVKLKARGYIVKSNSRGYTSRGEIFDMQNNLLASAEATYLKTLPTVVVTDKYSMAEEMCYHLEKDIDEIDFPPIQTI